MRILALTAIGALIAGGIALGIQQQQQASVAKTMKSKVGTRPGGVGRGTPLKPAAGHELAAFSGGCFWGVEDHFREIDGVVATAVGYTGGHVPNPTYEVVCTHLSGHVETVLVEFDPAKVSYRQLLEKFFTMHDPTQVNRQGPDYGENYKSAVWTFSTAQQKEVQAAIRSNQARFSKKIATVVLPAQPFWIAEEYHQQYHEKTGTAACPTGPF